MRFLRVYCSSALNFSLVLRSRMALVCCVAHWSLRVSSSSLYFYFDVFFMQEDTARARWY